jgi:hypothetical protein
VLVDKHAQKTALRLGVSPDAVRAEFKKVPAKKPAPADKREETPEPSTEAVPPSAHELWLLKLLLLHEDLVRWAAMHLDPEWVQHQTVREIVARRLAALAHETWTTLAAFLNDFDSAQAQSLITEATAEGRPIPEPNRQIVDVVMRLRNQFLDRQLAAMAHRSNQPETSEEERINLLRQQQQLRELKRQPLTPLATGD